MIIMEKPSTIMSILAIACMISFAICMGYATNWIMEKIWKKIDERKKKK